MGHAGFTECVLLAANTSVPWSELTRWSRARRQAAIFTIAESRGAKLNRNTWQLDWPMPGSP